MRSTCLAPPFLPLGLPIGFGKGGGAHSTSRNEGAECCCDAGGRGVVGLEGELTATSCPSDVEAAEEETTFWDAVESAGAGDEAAAAGGEPVGTSQES
jgi:hypothetical protein